MSTNPEIEEWIRTAPGVAMNPDGSYGLQCVDLVDQYGQDIFGVPWSACVGGVAGARELLDAAPDAYWVRTDNDPNNVAMLPGAGDVLVFGGTTANPYGHTCVCESADQSGANVVQQDGFAAPLIFVDGGWYSNKPAHRAWLPFWGPGTGMLSGWLTPRPEKIIGYQPPAGLEGYQRATIPDSEVGYRVAPEASAELIKWLDPDTVYDFKAYVVNAGEVWFVGKYTGGFSIATGFTDQGTHDLPDLTAVLIPPVVVTPPQPPEPVPPPEVFDYLNGIDVSEYQETASLQSIAADFYIIKATEGGGDWQDPALASNVAEARLTGKPVLFYHYPHPFKTPENTAAEELRSFLKAIGPYLQLGDGVILDWEGENRHRTDWAYEFLSGAREATGATPWFYGNLEDLNRTHPDWTDATRAEYSWDAVEAEFPLWFAYYGENAPGGYVPAKPPWPVEWKAGFRMWQYTSKGHLPGYDGDLDLDVFYGTSDDLRAMGATKVLTPPVEPDPGDIAKLTEFRDWLTGYIQELGAEQERSGTGGKHRL